MPSMALLFFRRYHADFSEKREHRACANKCYQFPMCVTCTFKKLLKCNAVTGHKKGNSFNCRNYRSVSLFDVVRKIFTSILCRTYGALYRQNLRCYFHKTTFTTDIYIYIVCDKLKTTKTLKTTIIIP